MKNYLKNALPTLGATSQSNPLTPEQVRNNAGGYVWQIDQWERLQRFLILGSESGSYYVSEKALTVENAQNVIKCIQADGERVVAEIVTISDSGRAPKNDPAIFVLALCISMGDANTRKSALEALPKVCRIGTHLFTLMELLKGQRGWGRALRRGVGSWYNAQTPKDMAYQVMKYRNRNGWTHTDVLRKSHPVPLTSTHDQIMRWVTHPDRAEWATAPTQPENEALALVWAFEQAQKAQTANEIVTLIRDYDLPREALPTQWLAHVAVWDALLQNMPIGAMIRNLGVMSKIGLLTAMSTAEKRVVERLNDQKRLQKARVHPIAILMAQKTYAHGQGMRGDGVWTPTAKVIDALDSAFELAFASITPTHKRTMLALDVSGSMGAGYVAGTLLTPRDASGAMAMVTARTESDYLFTAFQSQMVPLNISAKMRLDNVIKAISDLQFGATDCAQPMLYALEHKLAIDTFVIYTDSETWVGKEHPTQALHRYRDAMGIPAKLIVVGMVSNGFTIADPNDKGMMDVVGFDASAPAVMADFARAN